MAFLKNFGIAGVAKFLQFGKQGPQMDASVAGNVSLKDADRNQLINLHVRDADEPTHAVTLNQLVTTGKVDTIGVDVSYTDTEVLVYTPPKGIRVLKIIAEAETEWTNTSTNTDIEVGLDTNHSIMFSDFETDIQNVSSLDVPVGEGEPIKAFITQGDATSGTAHVWVWYATVGGLDGKFANTIVYHNDVSGGDATTDSFTRSYNGGSA